MQQQKNDEVLKTR